MIGRLYGVSYHDGGNDMIGPKFYFTKEDAEEFAEVCRQDDLRDVHVRVCDQEVDPFQLFPKVRLRKAIVPKEGAFQ